MTTTSAPAADQVSSPQQQQGANWMPQVPVAFLAAGITVLGALCIAWLVHRWSGTREKKSRFVSAATKFREAFVPDLAAIEHGKIGHLSLADYLRVAHDARHAAAVATFEPSISAKNVEPFRRAWQEYRYGENEDGTPAEPGAMEMDHDDLCFLCYSEGRSWETHIAQTNTQKAVARMRRLLSFAEET